MKNQCTQSHVKKILGKYSHCKPAPFGDVINLIQCFNIDRQTALMGRLATGDVDVKFVMRVIQGCEKWERGNKVMNQGEVNKTGNSDEAESCEDAGDKARKDNDGGGLKILGLKQG